MVVYIIIVSLVIDWLIANEFYLVACEKGYDSKKYLWYTFLFSILGVLMVVALPDRNKTSIENSSFSSNVVSAPKDKEDFIDRKPVFRAQHPSSPQNASKNSWTCKKCGKINMNYLTTCSCGNIKYNNERFSTATTNNLTK